jgi:diadenosine tetraphosphate (Ap4A) HIT family hydrolase
MAFDLHPRLAADTIELGDWLLCRVLLMDDARFPWIVLVPRLAGVTEILDLTRGQRAGLTEEVAAAGAALKTETRCDKLNVGSLGNVVSQLHVHVVGRFVDDPAWPGPVWGYGRALPYQPAAAAALADALARPLGLTSPARR